MKYYGKITGWGAHAPEKVMTNADMEKLVDTNDEWIVQRTGIRERRFAPEGASTCSLAVKAGEAALKKAGVKATELDLIIVTTTTPDYLAPAISSQVQDELGATNVPAMTLMTGCTGFVFSLSTAHQFIETGAYERILIIGAEVFSPYLDTKERSTAILFGDAAGAVVLERSTEPCGLKSFTLGSDGSRGGVLAFPTREDGGVMRMGVEKADGNYIRFNGREVFKFAVRALADSCREVLEQANMTIDDIDCIVPHQANERIVQAAARDLEVPMDRFYLNIAKYGNTSAASIPVALTEAIEEGVIKPNDRVLFSAFGAGLTWGAAVFELAPRESSESAVEVGASSLPIAAD